MQNADLLINGIPNSASVAPSFPDGKTVVFTLPTNLAAGTYSITINAGSIVDVQGTPIQPFIGTFVIDKTSPRVVSSSIVENDVKPIGSLTYTAVFSEDMETSVLDPSDFSLVGGWSGSHGAASLAWTDARTVQLQFDGTAWEDQYTLTLSSAVGKFQDPAGNPLDGEPHTPFSLPSGNGTTGGDFLVHFTTDVVSAPFPTPLNREKPAGSQIYDGSLNTAIGTSTDTDSYTISLDAGQTLTALVNPVAGLRSVVTIAGPSGVLGTAHRIGVPASRSSFRVCWPLLREPTR